MMASETASPQHFSATSQPGLLTLVACTFSSVVFLHVGLFRGHGNGVGTWGLVFPLGLAVASFAWLGVVSSIVTEPYLDEVFHIPQAQKYCEGKFGEWDDKITTPPGLYLLSVLVPQAAKSSNLISSYTCDPITLRATSVVGLLILSYLTLLCRREIEARLHEAHSSSREKPISQYALHTSLNIALFPLLFFFSGLYYTDVVSTAAVIGAFLNHLLRIGRDRSSFLSDFLTIVLGIFTLLMRQTNVFWVVVFMGGLEAVHAVKMLRPKKVTQPFMSTLGAQLKFFAWRYSVGDIHDLPLHMAYPEDMLYSVFSLLVAAICNPFRVLRQIWPYISVLLAFAGFVVWNGGVVLGDKSNHVATIHLAQMLYIWPLFGFFSLPLFVPYALPIANAIRAIFLSTFRRRDTKESLDSKVGTQSWGKPSSKSKTSSTNSKRASDSNRSKSPADLSYPLRQISTLFNSRVLWLAYLAATFALSGLVVRFNTIIHPFTLADNRHYMFYIFRYTIRRATWIRYFLILPYTISRWMVWGTMAGCSAWILSSYNKDCSAYYHSFRPAPFSRDPFRIAYTSSSRPTGVQTVGEKDTKVSTPQTLTHCLVEDPLLLSTEPVSTSTGLIFLLATTLSLMTAPLVEPRYFIIPWVMWRLMVPAWRLHDHRILDSMFKSVDTKSLLGKILEIFKYYDLRLILETLWFVSINLATGYIFLFKPYVWRAEDGTVLDDGRLQRFMW